MNDNELVDIVDRDCNIIDKTTKDEAHRKGLLHPTVIAEVINSKKEWLLVTQSQHKQEPGKFISPMGGHVTHGESFEEALKREMSEELGMTDFSYKDKGRFIYNVFVKNKQENHYFIVYEVFSDNIPKLSEESSEYRYFTVENLKRELKENSQIFGNSFLSVLENLYPELLQK